MSCLSVHSSPKHGNLSVYDRSPSPAIYSGSETEQVAKVVGAKPHPCLVSMNATHPHTHALKMKLEEPHAVSILSKSLALCCITRQVQKIYLDLSRTCETPEKQQTVVHQRRYTSHGHQPQYPHVLLPLRWTIVRSIYIDGVPPPYKRWRLCLT